MDDTPKPVDPAMLTYLRRLVTVLTVTMIAGLLVIIALFVIRFSSMSTAPAPLPERITLPEGARASAFTQGPDFLAVVTEDGRILIYDPTGGTPRQEIIVDQ